MTRPRISRQSRRALRTRASAPFLSDLNHESEPAWLELGRTELRVIRDGGDVAWSAALPDAAQALAGREWAARDLAALDPGADADIDRDEEVLLGRS